MSINCIMVEGRLTRDWEVKYTSGGTAVATNTVAVERSYENKDGERETDFLDVVVFGKKAETPPKYTGKGNRIVVRGQLQISTNKKDGKTYKNVNVVVDEFDFIDYKDDSPQGNGGSNQGGNNNTGNEIDDDEFDVPF